MRSNIEPKYFTMGKNLTYTLKIERDSLQGRPKTSIYFVDDYHLKYMIGKTIFPCTELTGPLKDKGKTIYEGYVERKNNEFSLVTLEYYKMKTPVSNTVHYEDIESKIINNLKELGVIQHV